MSIKTKDQLRTYWNTNINSNGAQAITGQVVNVGGIDIIDSVVTTTDPEAYQWFSDTDPTTIGLPDTGTYYQGVHESKRWVKNDQGDIAFSESGLWYIYEVTDAAIIPNEDWLGALVKWNGTSNGLITLDTSTFDVPVGWHFNIYNDTADLHIEIDSGGTDVVRSHNDMLFIPAYSYAAIGLMFRNGVAEWYASIEQDEAVGLGQMANGAAGISIVAGAGTWHEVVFPVPLYGTLTNVIAGPTDGSLAIDFPNNGTNGTYVTLSSAASIELAEANQTLDFSFGVDGVIGPDADFVKQSATSSGAQTSGQYWPFALSFSGVVNNGSYISLFVRSNVASTIAINSVNMNMRVEALIGIDIQTT